MVSLKSTTLRGFACGIGSIMSIASPVLAQQAVTLFNVVTVRDEIIIGLTGKDLSALGGDDAGFLGRALKANGELTAWQFAVRKGADGELEQTPLRLISIFEHDSLRIEPYATPLRIAPIERGAP